MMTMRATQLATKKQYLNKATVKARKQQSGRPTIKPVCGKRAEEIKSVGGRVGDDGVQVLKTVGKGGKTEDRTEEAKAIVRGANQAAQDGVENVREGAEEGANKASEAVKDGVEKAKEAVQDIGKKLTGE